MTTLLRELLKLSMTQVQHGSHVFEVSTEVRLLGGRYFRIEDDIWGRPGKTGRISITACRNGLDASWFQQEWTYNPHNYQAKIDEIEAAVTAIGGPVARIQRGPWVRHSHGGAGARYVSERIPVPRLLGMQQAVRVREKGTFEYGNAELHADYDSADPITMKKVPLKHALYLETNLLPDKKIRQLYGFKGSIESLLKGPQDKRKSPLTRIPFTKKDVRRLKLMVEDVPLAKRVLEVDLDDVPLAKRLTRR